MCDTPLPAHSASPSSDAQCAGNGVEHGDSTATIALPCVRGGNFGACDAQRFPSPAIASSSFGAVPPLPFMPGSGACSAQHLLSQSADSHCSEATFPLPILDSGVVCLLCDPSRKPMWASPALDCLACPGKHAPMEAADLTDNEEDSIEDGGDI